MEYVGHFHFPALPSPLPLSFSHPSFYAPPPHLPPSHFLFGCEEGERCWGAAASQGYRLLARWNCWYTLVGSTGLAGLISSSKAFNWGNQSKVSVIPELFFFFGVEFGVSASLITFYVIPLSFFHYLLWDTEVLLKLPAQWLMDLLLNTQFRFFFFNSHCCSTSTVSLV